MVDQPTLPAYNLLKRNLLWKKSPFPSLRPRVSPCWSASEKRESRFASPASVKWWRKSCQREEYSAVRSSVPEPARLRFWAILSVPLVTNPIGRQRRICSMSAVPKSPNETLLDTHIWIWSYLEP